MNNDWPFHPEQNDLDKLNEARAKYGIPPVLATDIRTVGEWRRFCDEIDVAAEVAAEVAAATANATESSKRKPARRARCDNAIFSAEYFEIEYRGLRIVIDCEGENEGQLDGVFIYDKDNNELSSTYFNSLTPRLVKPES